MWTCRASCAAAEADDLTSLDTLANMDEKAGIMSVQGREAIEMVEFYRLSVGPVIAGKHHNALLSGADGRSGRDAEIDAGVEPCPASTHHMPAFSKR